jgi:hypothetical protein
MERLMPVHRKLLEDTIEELIDLLDQADGDPDLEDDEAEEQHDGEVDLTWQSDGVPCFYLIAEAARRRGKLG